MHPGILRIEKDFQDIQDAFADSFNTEYDGNFQPQPLKSFTVSSYLIDAEKARFSSLF